MDEPLSDLIKTHNPACDINLYDGGLGCCGGTDLKLGGAAMRALRRSKALAAAAMGRLATEASSRTLLTWQASWRAASSSTMSQGWRRTSTAAGGKPALASRAPDGRHRRRSLRRPHRG